MAWLKTVFGASVVVAAALLAPTTVRAVGLGGGTTPAATPFAPWPSSFAGAADTSGSADPPPPVLTAGSSTVNVGDVFVIPISISDAQGLTAFQFDLAFNPTFVKALSFTDMGTDFATAASNGGGSLTGITGFIDNTTGVLSGVADLMSGLITGTGLTPSGVLVDVDFQALAIGTSSLVLSNAFLIDNGVPLSTSNLVLQNGQVRGVPEPSTLVLLSFALGGLGTACVLAKRRPHKQIERTALS